MGNWTTYYTLSDIQAVEPEELPVDPWVTVVLEVEHDDTSARAARVCLYAEQSASIEQYLLVNWGDDEATGGWTSERLAEIEEHAGPDPMQPYSVVDINRGDEVLWQGDAVSPLDALDQFAAAHGVATYSSCLTDAPMMGDEIVHVLTADDLNLRAVFSNTEVETRNLTGAV